MGVDPSAPPKPYSSVMVGDDGDWPKAAVADSSTRKKMTHSDLWSGVRRLGMAGVPPIFDMTGKNKNAESRDAKTAPAMDSAGTFRSSHSCQGFGDGPARGAARKKRWNEEAHYSTMCGERGIGIQNFINL